jgi:hypothetical protein
MVQSPLLVGEVVPVFPGVIVAGVNVVGVMGTEDDEEPPHPASRTSSRHVPTTVTRVSFFITEYLLNAF